MIQWTRKSDDNDKYKKPAIVTVDIGSAVVALQYLNHLYPESEQLMFEKIALDSQDFKALITKLKSKKVDAIVLLALNQQSITFAKQSNCRNSK